MASEDEDWEKPEIKISNGIEYIEVEWDTPPPSPKQNHEELAKAIQLALEPKKEVKDEPKKIIPVKRRRQNVSL